MYFNPHANIEITERQLPHWRQEEVTYFITSRLADSIPQSKLRLWKLKRDEFLETHSRPLSSADRQKFHKTFTRKMEEWLDSGMGSCPFKEKKASELLADTLTHFDGIRYDLDEWVIMPNHVHVVVTPKANFELTNILHSWKSFSARQVNDLLNRKGVLWQDESYDQIVRSEIHHYRIGEYIRRNPEKAGVMVHQASWR